jgi:hypothetical protein
MDGVRPFVCGSAQPARRRNTFGSINLHGRRSDISFSVRPAAAQKTPDTTIQDK